MRTETVSEAMAHSRAAATMLPTLDARAHPISAILSVNAQDSWAFPGASAPGNDTAYARPVGAGRRELGCAQHAFDFFLRILRDGDRERNE